MSNSPFKELGPDAVYDGVTKVTWMAGLVNVEPGDIIEIRWGTAATLGFDRGRVSTGTVSSIQVSEGRGPNGRFKRGEIMLRPGWHEETQSSVVYDGGLMFIPNVVEMPFPHTFDLRTDDVEDESWILVILGHDCDAHLGEACASQWKPRAAKYLAEHPEVPGFRKAQ